MNFFHNTKRLLRSDCSLCWYWWNYFNFLLIIWKDVSLLFCHDLRPFVVLRYRTLELFAAHACRKRCTCSTRASESSALLFDRPVCPPKHRIWPRQTDNVYYRYWLLYWEVTCIAVTEKLEDTKWTIKNRKGQATNCQKKGWFGFMVFNATFNTISAISWRSVLLVEETEGPAENHRPFASHWQTLSHNSIHLALVGIRTHNITGDGHWLYTPTPRSQPRTELHEIHRKLGVNSGSPKRKVVPSPLVAPNVKWRGKYGIYHHKSWNIKRKDKVV